MSVLVQRELGRQIHDVNSGERRGKQQECHHVLLRFRIWRVGIGRTGNRHDGRHAVVATVPASMVRRETSLSVAGLASRLLQYEGADDAVMFP